MPIKPISARALTMAYVVALLIIAGLSIASHLALESSLRNNEGSAAVINKSGRQRMLSQRIVALAGQWKSGDITARDPLRGAISELEINHDVLIRGLQDGLLGGGNARQLQRLYFGGANSLDSEVRAFVTDARQVADLAPNDPRLDQPLSRIVDEARAPLLIALDNVVTTEQRWSEKRTIHLEHLQWGILTIVLVTLMIEASLIFRPMMNRIVAYTAELSRLATIDPLTGIANRRSFIERSEAEIMRARRHQRPVSILMIDVDHFKSINDTYGHAAGDCVLMAIGDALRTTLRDIDIFGRFGGEEFAALLVETALPEARMVAERLRSRFEAMNVRCEGKTIKLTASIGCTRLDDDAARLEDALRAADKLMYLAKETGRNRVAADAPAIPSPISTEIAAFAH